MGRCREFGYVLWANAVYLVMRNGPLQWEFVDALWAAVANLVTRHGTLRGMSHTVKICDNFHAVDHSAGFGYVPLAIAQDLVCAIGHSAGFCYALWMTQGYKPLWLSIVNDTAESWPRSYTNVSFHCLSSYTDTAELWLSSINDTAESWIINVFSAIWKTNISANLSPFAKII
jgi:hypothetical protein